jgi:tol-pal system protein YbgF
VRLLSLLFFLALSAFPQSESDKEFIELYLKIQALEKEIALLRNEVEVLEAQVDFYQDRSDKRLDDLDTKLLSLMSIDDLQNSPVVSTTNQTLDNYEQAIVLIQQGRLDEALGALNVFVQSSQDSTQTPLAYFWLGEIHLNKGNLSAATQNFNTLLGLYPSHWRIPLAKYKLGTIYLEEGNLERARAQFQSVIEDFPESSAAKASRESLSSLE